MLELREGLRRAANVTQDRGALGRAGVRAERKEEVEVDERLISLRSFFCSFTVKKSATVPSCDAHLTDAVRERCSLESITQPT